MRTETMIAGAVALAAGYNSFATAGHMAGAFAAVGGRSDPALSNLPSLPFDFFVPVAIVGVVAAAATVWLGAEDLTNYAVRGNPRPFESLTLPCER